MRGQSDINAVAADFCFKSAEHQIPSYKGKVRHFKWKIGGDKPDQKMSIQIRNIQGC